MKRISGITDLRGLETIGPGTIEEEEKEDDDDEDEEEELYDDMLIRRAQALGTMSSHSLY